MCWTCTLAVNYALVMGIMIIQGSDGLKDVLLQGPYFIRRGQDAILTCQYDMEHEPLYAVKWYRSSEEFYRFVPKEAPPQKVFHLQHHPIQIDVHRSNSHQIFVKNVSFSLTGTYKCVVSAETTFQTLSDVRNIAVVAVGYDPPKLQLNRSSYHPGDFVQANCSIGKTFPGPTISWLLNDLENQFLKESTISIVDELDPPIANFISTVAFKLPETYLPSKLSCKVTLMDLYSEISMKKIQPVPRNYTFIGGGGGIDSSGVGIVPRSSKSSPLPSERTTSSIAARKLDSLRLKNSGSGLARNEVLLIILNWIFIQIWYSS